MGEGIGGHRVIIALMIEAYVRGSRRPLCAIAIVATAVLAASCGGSSVATTTVVHPRPFPATRRFRAREQISIGVNALPLPGLSDSTDYQSGTVSEYLDRQVVKIIGSQTLCYSQGGWLVWEPEQGHRRSITLAQPLPARDLAAFLSDRPGVILNLAELSPPPSQPSTWKASFPVSTAQIVRTATSAAPPAIRSAARREVLVNARLARTPVKLTTWWSSSQPGMPQRVKVEIDAWSWPNLQVPGQPRIHVQSVLDWRFHPGGQVVDCRTARLPTHVNDQTVKTGP